MPTKVYSADQISITFGGVPIESGRGNDEFVSIVQPEDTFTVQTGVDGEVTRSENKGAAAIREVTITLRRTSRGNAVLSAMHKGDVAIAGGSGIAPLAIVDLQGASLFVSPEAWIKKWPDDKHAAEAPTVEWTFTATHPEQVIGGN